MRVISTQTDKNSNPNYCAWANIGAGHILSIHDETGREGGELWSKDCKYPDANGGMVSVMKSLARNWPNWYAKVKEKAYRDALPVLKGVQRQHADYDINCLQGSIEELEAQIREKKRKIRKIRNKR